MPSERVAVLAKPGDSTVHCVLRQAAKAGNGLIAMLKVCMVISPALSVMVTLLANVPVCIGVPMKATALPLTTAVKPVGTPDWAGGLGAAADRRAGSPLDRESIGSR